MWRTVALALLVTVGTLLCVLLFMLFGWFVVWRLFLSKFKFLRELVGDAGTPQAESQPSSAAVRNRPKRQRLTES